MIPFFSMTGELVSPLVLIFKGTGKQISPEEEAFYRTLPNICVLWQKKAWIDHNLEVMVMENQVKPYVLKKQKEYEDAGKAFPGFLLLEDRGPGHDDMSALTSSPSFTLLIIISRKVLEVAKKADIEIVLTPADTTWAIQLVDDGRGKALRKKMMEEFDQFLAKFNWVSNPRGKLTSQEKRILTAQIAQNVFINFSACPHQRELTIRAATRTGGRMEMTGNYDLIQPVRFPKDFGYSILPGHPLSMLVKKYVPLSPNVVSPQAKISSTATLLGAQVVITPDLTVTSTATARLSPLSAEVASVSGGSIMA